MENYEIHKELLNLPKYTFPACMLTLGGTGITVFATSLDDVVNQTQAEVSVETPVVAETTQQPTQVTQTTQAAPSANADAANAFMDEVKQATDLSEVSPGATKVNEGIKKIASFIVQILSYFVTAFLVVRVVVDLCYICIPFTRSFLANGYGGNAQAGAGGMGGTSLGSAYRGVAGDTRGVNGAGAPQGAPGQAKTGGGIHDSRMDRETSVSGLSGGAMRSAQAAAARAYGQGGAAGAAGVAGVAGAAGAGGRGYGYGAGGAAGAGYAGAGRAGAGRAGASGTGVGSSDSSDPRAASEAFRARMDAVQQRDGYASSVRGASSVGGHAGLGGSAVTGGSSKVTHPVSGMSLDAAKAEAERQARIASRRNKRRDE
jgi:hypothetical protein